MAKTKTTKKPKKEVKKVTPTEPKNLVVKLISYTVKATIPTMSYGNIMPEITVEARTMEEAKLAVMPHIEELYRTYAEAPRDGSRGPAFLQKASVTSTERVVPQGKVGDTKLNPPVAPKAEAPVAPATPAPVESVDALAEDLKTSPAFDKAAGAINNTTSMDALNLIEDQIQKSTKLTADEKPVLLTEVLKKRKTFA